MASEPSSPSIERRVRSTARSAWASVFFGLFEEDPALRGQPRGAMTAVQKRSAEFVFQVGDLLGDGGLRDVQVTRRLAKRSVFGNGAEVA